MILNDLMVRDGFQSFLDDTLDIFAMPNFGKYRSKLANERNSWFTSVQADIALLGFFFKG